MTGQANLVSWCCSGASSWWPFWYSGMVTISSIVSSRDNNWCRNSSCADGTMHFSNMPMHLVALSIPSTICRRPTGSQAAPDHDLQRMLHHQVKALQLEFFSTKPPHICMDLVANRQKVLFIAEQHLLPHLLTPAGVLPSPRDSIEPLDVGHKWRPACLAAPQTELQALLTNCWWAGNHVALLPSLTQQFRQR